MRRKSSLIPRFIATPLNKEERSFLWSFYEKMTEGGRKILINREKREKVGKVFNGFSGNFFYSAVTWKFSWKFSLKKNSGKIL